MNKAQLIDAIAEKAGLTKADSKKALEAFVETVGEALKGGDKVALIGFGSFSLILFNALFMRAVVVEMAVKIVFAGTCS